MAQILDLLQVCTSIGGVVGFAFAVYQWRISIKTKRAEFVNMLFEKYLKEKSIRKFLYMIEYQNDWYNNRFHGSNLEPKVDNSLSYYSYIVYLYETGVISEIEFELFQYDVIRILQNQSLKRYLWNLYHWSKSINTDFVYSQLLMFGEKKGLIGQEFFNARSSQYIKSKYLNF